MAVDRPHSHGEVTDSGIVGVDVLLGSDNLRASRGDRYEHRRRQEEEGRGGGKRR